MSRPRYKKWQGGLSLVELLVSMLISAILISVMMTIYLSNSRSIMFTKAFTEVHQTARTTKILLTRELQNSNFWGCVTGTNTTVNNIATDSHGYNPSLHDYRQSFIAENDITAAGKKTGSDSIKFFYVSDTGVRLTQNMSRSFSNIQVNDASGFAKHDIVLITNCQDADIFVLSQAQTQNNSLIHNSYATEPGNGNLSTNPGCAGGHCLSIAYGKGSSIMAMQHRSFFLNTDNMLVLNDGKQEFRWIAGIEDLQFEFGIDTNNDDAPDIYVTADDTLFSRTKTRAIRAYVLLVSSAKANVNEETFQYAGKTVTADDGHYRYLLEMNVSLRNFAGGTQ